jgi:hypothetical protein
LRSPLGFLRRRRTHKPWQRRTWSRIRTTGCLIPPPPGILDGYTPFESSFSFTRFDVGLVLFLHR